MPIAAELLSRFKDLLGDKKQSEPKASSADVAGNEPPPIPLELVAVIENYDLHFAWNNRVRIFGLHINRLAEALNLAIPKLSDERIAEIKTVISTAQISYYMFKSRESTNDRDQVQAFVAEIDRMSDQLKLVALDTELLELASKQ